MVDGLSADQLPLPPVHLSSEQLFTLTRPGGGAVAAVTGVVAASAGGAVAACVCHGAVCIAMRCRLVVFIASVNAAKRKRLDEQLIHAARAETLSDM